MDSPVGFFLFLGIFQFVGLTFIGVSLRQIVAPGDTLPKIFKSFFRIVFGAVFAAVPLFMGYQEMGLVFVGWQVVIGAIFLIGVVLLWPKIQGWLQDRRIYAIGLGGIFFVIGLAAGGAMLRQGELIAAFVFGGLFAGIGLLIMLPPLLKLITGRASDDTD